jgi:hypothetical protein
MVRNWATRKDHILLSSECFVKVAVDVDCPWFKIWVGRNPPVLIGARIDGTWNHSQIIRDGFDRVQDGKTIRVKLSLDLIYPFQLTASLIRALSFAPMPKWDHGTILTLEYGVLTLSEKL